MLEKAGTTILEYYNLKVKQIKSSQNSFSGGRAYLTNLKVIQTIEFFLKSLGDKKNKLEVEKLFKNFSLQKKLLSKPLNIESNGDVMFYYWDRYKFPVEEFEERISEVEFLHDNYFDVIV